MSLATKTAFSGRRSRDLVSLPTLYIASLENLIPISLEFLTDRTVPCRATKEAPRSLAHSFLILGLEAIG
ncbi:hypothetical protein V2H45_21160 [Tumidithrix elongata RA019]|uniref:Uncharacterized protein n=1 Tax=Tumidithrix elongata BACA0141 TaxID=2716417 RepID=A0AAW9Q7S3_9CYAN|nr:hypothetical protein [Tumidithrix elongata RA019]